jgi:hypothetical protein
VLAAGLLVLGQRGQFLFDLLGLLRV